MAKKYHLNLFWRNFYDFSFLALFLLFWIAGHFYYNVTHLDNTNEKLCEFGLAILNILFTYILWCIIAYNVYNISMDDYFLFSSEYIIHKKYVYYSFGISFGILLLSQLFNYYFKYLPSLIGCIGVGYICIIEVKRFFERVIVVRDVDE